MSDKAGGKPGPRRSRSRSVRKGHGKGSTSKESGKRGSASGTGGRKMSRRRKPSIARHCSSGLVKTASDTAATAQRGSTQANDAKRHRASGARPSTGGGSRKSLIGLHSAIKVRAEEFSSREVQAIRARCGRMTVGVTVAVVVVVVLATFSYLTWFVAAPKAVIQPSTMRGFSLIARLTAACSTDDCRTAVAMMNTSVDPSANPCEDVYKYACGNWHVKDEDGRLISYEQNVKNIYVDSVDSELVGNATTDSLCRTTEPKAKMGCIYTSCVAFYTNRSSSLEDLLTAAKIDPDEWMRVKDFKELFYLGVRKIVDTGVVSVLNITKRDAQTAVIEVGTCISCSVDDGDSFMKFLLDQAVSIKV